MNPMHLELLYQEWKWLVSECASAMSAARGNGASAEELCSEERRHGLRIDGAYARLKQAEARSGARIPGREATYQADSNACN
jgi:D-arabinose 1-dehydrogenase-like Zn-dependent alcohol dehydrogenase